MYERLTVDLLDLHPPMALNPRGLSQIYPLICNFLWPRGTILRCNMSWGEWRLNATTVVWMAEIYEQYISLPALRSLMFLHSNNVTCLLVLTNLEHRHQSILFWSTSIDQLVEHRKSSAYQPRSNLAGFGVSSLQTSDSRKHSTHKRRSRNDACGR